MAKLILDDVQNLENTNSSKTVINNNSAAIETAMENTLSRDGTGPNSMGADFDMDSHRILNLPKPVNAVEPLRLQDLSDFLSSGTVSNIPAGGNSGDVLAKTSNTSYLFGWVADSSLLTAGSNIVVTGTSPATVATTLTPTFTTVNKVTITAPATGSTLTIANGKTLTVSNTLTFTGTDSSSAAFGAGGIVAYKGTDLSQFASTTSAQLLGVLSDETGSGLAVFNNTPTLIAPLLGTPTSGNLSNCTALPLGSITGFATGIATFLATPTSVNLKAAITDETGSGALVFANTPTLVTPVLGAATATTINGITISASTGSLILNTNTLGLPGSGVNLNLQGTGTTTQTFPTTSATLARTDAAQTFNGIQGFASQVGVSGILTVGTTSGTALYVANAGGSNPTFNVDTSTASSATGVNVKGAAAGGAVAIAAISSGTNEGLTIDAKGTGSISIGQIASAPAINLGGAGPTVTIGQSGAAVLNVGKSGLASGTIVLAGSSSGALTIVSTAVASGTITLPNGTDTIVGRASTDTLTNKSISGSTNTLSSIALSSHATQAAFTLVGNNTSGSAAPTAIDIATLTAKASPTAADLVMISDQAASGAWKKVTISSLASAGSVASLGGATGAITITGGNLPGTVLTMPRYDAAQTLSAGEQSQVRTNIGVSVGVPDVVIEEQQASGTGGGAHTSGSWFTRVLNTTVRNFGSIASLASNQVTLGAGTYYAVWSSPAAASDPHQTRLFNATDSTVIAYGSSEYASSATFMGTRSHGSIVFTIAGSKAIRIEHRVTTSSANASALGGFNSFGGTNVYSRIEITKL